MGLRDTIVVHTPDATLVANRHDEESIRRVVKELEERVERVSLGQRRATYTLQDRDMTATKAITYAVPRRDLDRRGYLRRAVAHGRSADERG